MNEYNPKKHAQRLSVVDIPDDLPALEDATLPDPSSDYDKAWGSARTKPVATLHCLMGAKGYESFTYAHLAAHHSFTFGQGQEIVLEFTDSKRWRVTIQGRGMLKLFDYVLQCRMPWIRKADRDFAKDKEPIITDIVITEIKED